MEFSEPSSGKYDEKFMKEFPYDNVSPKAKNEDLASLLYTAEYVARKARSQTDCNECKELFGNKGNTTNFYHTHFQYTHHLIMLGLIYPSNFLLMVLQAGIIYLIFVLLDILKITFSLLNIKSEHCLSLQNISLLPMNIL